MALVLAIALALAPTALASTEDIIAPSDPAHPAVNSGWQAGTCFKDAPTCSIETPEQFFEQAAGHPPVGFTQFIVRHEPAPIEELKTVRVDLPVGLSVNPGATPRCSQSQFDASACPPESEVGTSIVVAADPLLGTEAPPLEAPVFNIAPPEGQAARFGFSLGSSKVYLEGDVAWSSDYHEGFTIHVPAVSELPVLGGGFILKNRFVFDGRSGDRTFITTPSTCLGPAYAPGWVEGEPPNGPSGHAYSTWLLASSVEEEKKPGYVFPQSAEPALESPIPPGTSPKECETIPYEPGIEVDPGTAQTDSPAAASVAIDLPHLLPTYDEPGGKEGEDVQDTSPTRDASVTLPVGMGLNASAAHGLQTCSDEQFGKGTRNPVTCPEASKIGTATIESPALPEGNLEGPIYAGEQLSRDPTSGVEYRIFIDVASARYGIDSRLIGNVSADPRTGQLTTTLADDPQVPVTSFVTHFFGGPHAVLSSPPTCGPNEAGAVMTPWSGNAPATPTAGFSMTAAPGGGSCAKTMAERPFAPSFAAGPDSAKAGAFSPVTLRISRPDGQQELKGTDVTLPPGMTGKLAGIPYCPEAALAAASALAGRDEAAHPSCPAESQVGVARVSVGTGSDPYGIEGEVFLAGPYHGAPLSLAVVTPATAGPFDLGTVVVRVALFVDPETAQIHAVSDPFPHVFGGTQLNVRSIEVTMNRPSFTLNPTSCDPLATTGSLLGGGADPADPAAFSSFAVSSPFQTTECDALGFRPKLSTKLLGGRKALRRSGNPAFRAVLVAREGDANISRAALTLPHSELLDQGHIGTICTRVQLAAAECPARSVYGYAWAKTPLLDGELQGPVYLVSSDHELPDLLADLHGQVDVRLRGVISSAKARIKTVFSALPDVPVSRFTIKMKGGRKGLLENTRNLCGRPSFSVLSFQAQNGKKLRVKRLPLRAPGCHR